MALRLVYMGTPVFAVTTLMALVDAGHNVVCAYTQPPRKAGRGRRERPSPVQVAAADLGIEVRTPENFRAAEERTRLAELQPDVIVVVAYGLLLPKAVLEVPRLGCLNVHASLLPRWRGAAPIQRAILAGDDRTGVSIMMIDEGLDTGPVLSQGETAIGESDTAGTLHDRLADLGARLMVETLAGLAGGTLKPTSQPDEGASYARKIDREDEEMDWHRTCHELDRQVRALAPGPGAWFRHGGERIKVLAGLPIEDESGEPGVVIDDVLTVACGDGALRLSRLQREGRKALGADAFLRGLPVPRGTRLGPDGTP